MSPRTRTIRIELTVDDATYVHIADATWNHLDDLGGLAPFPVEVFHDHSDTHLAAKLDSHWAANNKRHWT